VLGLTALLFSLFLPKGIWGYVEDRFHVLLLPVGYRVHMSAGGPVAGPSKAVR
jgi:branched-chain amino acid transport system permease protein